MISAKRDKLDWARLFVSRLLRLAPLYLFAMLFMFVIIIGLSGGSIHEPMILLIKHAVEWLAFSVVGGPDVNGLKNTSLITAGVTWSLPYEWAFYCLLPLLALFVGQRPPARYVALALLTTVGFAALAPNSYYLLAFGGGIAAAWLARWVRFCKFASTAAASVVIIGSVSAVVSFFPTVQNAYAMLSLSIAFAFIACGNTFFGILIHPVSRTLGTMSYGIYLMHGIVLFTAFNIVTGVSASRRLSPTGHWLIVFAITPLLISICYAGYRLIEQPAMRNTDRVTNWLSRHSLQQIWIRATAQSWGGLRRQ